jgi:hypothetical protein
VGFVTENIYRSSNGDRWSLIRDSTNGRQFVRHEANPSSGGHVTDTDIDEFLSVDGSRSGSSNRLAQPGSPDPHQGDRGIESRGLWHRRFMRRLYQSL